MATSTGQVYGHVPVGVWSWIRVVILKSMPVPRTTSDADDTEQFSRTAVQEVNMLYQMYDRRTSRFDRLADRLPAGLTKVSINLTLLGLSDLLLL